MQICIFPWCFESNPLHPRISILPTLCKLRRRVKNHTVLFQVSIQQPLAMGHKHDQKQEQCQGWRGSLAMMAASAVRGESGDEEGGEGKEAEEAEGGGGGMKDKLPDNL